MKHVVLVVTLAATCWWASGLPAQVGLYGSPETLNLAPYGQGMPQPVYPSTAASPNAGRLTYWGQAPVGPPALEPTPASPLPQPARIPPPPAGSGAPRPSVVGQMFAEPGAAAAAQSWAGYGCANGDCGQAGIPTADACATCYQPAWYISATGLIMSRDQANRLWTSYRTNFNAQQDMHTQNAALDWQGGYEFRIGRTFGCGQWAVEGGYWKLAQLRGFASRTRTFPDSLSTPLDFTDVVYENPAIADDPVTLFDFAREHRLWRTNDFQNVEVNLVRHQIAGDCANALDLDWLVGVRYFQFDERLTFGSLQQNVPPDPPYTWGGNGGVNEGYLDEEIHNALIGVQLGARLHYPLGAKGLRAFIAPEVGLYHNHINHRFSAYRGDGERFAPNPGSGVTGSFPVSRSTDTIAFLTQIDAGLDWQITHWLDLFVGYRVIVATGIGLADNQFHPYVVDIPAYQHIETNGQLVLHGGFAGVGVRF